MIWRAQFRALLLLALGLSLTLAFVFPDGFLGGLGNVLLILTILSWIFGNIANWLMIAIKGKPLIYDVRIDTNVKNGGAKASE